MAKTYKPGQRVPASSQVEIIGPRGGRTGEERTVTPGEKFPPAPGRGEGHANVDRTKNNSGKGKRCD